MAATTFREDGRPLAVSNPDGTVIGGGGGGGAVTVADAADVAQGAVADAAVAAGAVGTISAKLRRLTTDLNTALGYVDGLEALLAGGLPAALAAGGGLKVEGVAGGVAQPMSLAAATSGGSVPYRNIDLGVTGQVIKNGAGQIYGITLMNRAAAERFFKFYNKATAPDQTDTPVITYAMPATSNMVIASPDGVAYATGISVRASTGIADNDVGAPSTNDCVLSVRYK